MIKIVVARDSQMKLVRQLFLEYADTLGFDLDFQRFDRDINELPGKYGPPDGVILLAEVDGEVAGCVALRKIEGDTCEMKRLWVRPQFRGLKIGRKLSEALLEHARGLGYIKMRLDTIDTMTSAIGLYKALGFVEIEAYYDNPIEGATYFEKDLTV